MLVYEKYSGFSVIYPYNRYVSPFSEGHAPYFKKIRAPLMKAIMIMKVIMI